MDKQSRLWFFFQFIQEVEQELSKEEEKQVMIEKAINLKLMCDYVVSCSYGFGSKVRKKKRYQMSKNNSYHFHRDCRYYEQCKEETVTEGKHKYIKFVCPRLKNPQKYYPKDLHTIKWICPHFEPKASDEQLNNILDILEVKK